MNLEAKFAIESAMRRLEKATHLLEDAACGGGRFLVGLAYADVLLARGEFAAAIQLIELEEMLGKADTQPPAALPPLRIVP